MTKTFIKTDHLKISFDIQDLLTQIDLLEKEIKEKIYALNNDDYMLTHLEYYIVDAIRTSLREVES